MWNLQISFKWAVTKYICSSELKRFWFSTKSTCEMNSLQKSFFPFLTRFDTWVITPDKPLKMDYFFHFCSSQCTLSSDLRFHSDFRRLKPQNYLFRIKREKKKDFLGFRFFQVFKLEMSDFRENVLTRLGTLLKDFGGFSQAPDST